MFERSTVSAFYMQREPAPTSHHPKCVERGRRNGETSNDIPCTVTATLLRYITSAVTSVKNFFPLKTDLTMSTTTTVTNTLQHPLEDIELVPIDRNARDVQDEDTSLTREAHNKDRDWKRLFQLISCGVSFFVAGVNDGSLGALLPYIIRSYGLTTAIASSV